MNKPKFETPDMTMENIDKIANLFPNCITETKDADGKLKKAINFDMLKQMLSKDIADGDEAYEFTWIGKKAAIVEANTPIRKTLRPVIEDEITPTGKDSEGNPYCSTGSVNWDTTQNLYIEGDNLEVLKLLQESYLNKIKMIYIDPPYNTGSDSFVYDDNFEMNKDEYEEGSGLFDENGNKQFKENNDSRPRFHSDWCSMIYSRLLLARNLLKEDGVIFISIGQGEIDNLRKICDELFGRDNSCGIISRVMKSGGAKGRFFSPNIEYVLVYSKSIFDIQDFREPISEEIINKLYTSIETEGERKGQKYRPFGLYQSSLDSRPNQRYFIECPDGELVIPPGVTMPKQKKDGETVLPQKSDGCWRWSHERYLDEKSKGNISFKKSNGVLINENGTPAHWNVYSKIWLSNREESGMVPVDLISKWENRLSTKELSDLKIPFDFAKPVDLIQYLINISQKSQDEVILDFFSGSATTGQAVMQLNAEDGGKRKFIMIQLPEKTDENSDAYKANFKNICEIGKERIRRAAKKIQKEHPDSKFDTGFRVLKVDDTNMKDVYYAPTEYKQDNLELFESNIKDGRSSLDLLYGCLLDWGLPLSLPYSSEKIEKFTVYTYNTGDVIACFDKDVTERLVKDIARRKPLGAIFRDSSFLNSSAKINVFEIFKMISLDTDVKVI